MKFWFLQLSELKFQFQGNVSTRLETTSEDVKTPYCDFNFVKPDVTSFPARNSDFGGKFSGPQCVNMDGLGPERRIKTSVLPRRLEGTS